MHVPGVDPARRAHPLCHQAGLAPRRGAGVQDLHARLRPRRLGGQHGALTLYRKESLPIALVGGQIARARDDIGVLHDPSTPGKSLGGKPALEGGGVHAQAVGAHGLRPPVRRPGRDGFGGFQPIGVDQPPRRGGRNAVSGAEPGHRVALAVGQGQRPGVPVADQVAQHAVHQPGKALPAGGAHLLDRLVHGGVVRHPVHEQDLGRGDVLYVVHHRLGPLVHKPAQHVLDVQPVLHGAVEQARGQAAVLRLQASLLQAAVQGLGGIGVAPDHVLQRPQRRVPGGNSGPAVQARLMLCPAIPRGTPVRLRAAASRLSRAALWLSLFVH